MLNTLNLLLEGPQILIRNACKNGLLVQVPVQKEFYCNFVGTGNQGTKRRKLVTEIKEQFTIHLLLLNMNSIIESKGTYRISSNYGTRWQDQFLSGCLIYKYRNTNFYVHLTKFNEKSMVILVAMHKLCYGGRYLMCH